MNDKIKVNMINLTPTMQCNLKCKLCGVMVPHYDYRPKMDRDEFGKTLNAVFEIIDEVDKLQITGGEPLVHPELPQFIEDCFKYSDQFKKLWLFTNCSIKFKTELLEVLKKYCNKIFVHISDYGVKHEIAEPLIDTLKDIGCEYRYLKYWGDNQYFDGWVDQGDFVMHGRTVEELTEIFRTCPHVRRGGSWYVRNGQMHWCGRSIRGSELGKIPKMEHDYLNIFDGAIDERRHKFLELSNLKYISACNYCNGNYGSTNTKRYPAGEQM